MQCLKRYFRGLRQRAKRTFIGNRKRLTLLKDELRSAKSKLALFYEPERYPWFFI